MAAGSPAPPLKQEIKRVIDENTRNSANSLAVSTVLSRSGDDATVDGKLGEKNSSAPRS